MNYYFTDNGESKWIDGFENGLRQIVWYWNNGKWVRSFSIGQNENLPECDFLGNRMNTRSIPEKEVLLLLL